MIFFKAIMLSAHNHVVKNSKIAEIAIKTSAPSFCAKSIVFEIMAITVAISTKTIGAKVNNGFLFLLNK